MSGRKVFQAEAIISTKALRWEEGPSLSVKQQGGSVVLIGKDFLLFLSEINCKKFFSIGVI